MMADMSMDQPDADLTCTSGTMRKRYCVPDPMGVVCTERCASDSDCPEGWDCLPVANTARYSLHLCGSAGGAVW